MRLTLGIVALILVSSPLLAQQSTGSVRFSFSAVEGTEAEGIGTTSVRFTGSEQIGVLSIELSPNIQPSTTPFLLGRVEFLPGGTFPGSVTFEMAADVFAADCDPVTLKFNPSITFSQFTEPGYQEQQAIFSKDTPSRLTLDGNDYTFGFAGLSTSTTFDPNGGDTIAAVLGNGPSSAYLFGSIDRDLPFTQPENCNCHPPGVPEPSTCLLLAVAAAVGYVHRRKRIA